MSRWDIDPPGVAGVVTRTGEAAKGFETAATKYGAALEGAAGACGSEIVAGALAGFAQHKAPAMKAVVERTGRALTGAVNATKAYIDGDLEMARTAQANAVAPPPGNDFRGR
ncbi:DUF6507 family protein [Couchioplanes azureus]|uniref:DUF6507 family protein n=1 Tax=Couchioplanes caeruleus TaxID=56438 RepID=UPI00166F7A9B|nr:DUF6507 family protein [Couchioplanes caeruleus]GGQ71400.1 hypothetical protein GCM10010166_46920 [Couchioplanes caeruleus subsp. azureus]